MSMNRPEYLSCLLVLLSHCQVFVSGGLYADYVTMQVDYTSSNDIEEILEKIKSVAKTCSKLDEYAVEGRPLNLLCSSADAEHLIRLSNSDFGEKFRVRMSSRNVEGLINHQKRQIGSQEIPGRSRAFEPGTFTHNSFLDYEPMIIWLKDINSRFNFVSLKIIGMSVEKRPIYAVTINDHLVDKPIILLEGGAHSREWISTASILYLIEKLAGLTVSVTNEDLPLLNFRWHIFPNINPDGHAYTHNVDRFWSKNRRQNMSGKNCTQDLTDCCNGVNINRNFPSGFGFGPTDPCDRAYIGPFAASEPETMSVVNYTKTVLVNRTVAAITFHSFGQVFFAPYAHNNSIPVNIKKILSLVYNTTFFILPYYFRHGTVDQFVRPAQKVGGTSMDYYCDEGIPYSFDIELPDLGELGMLLSPTDILVVGEALILGFRMMCTNLFTEFGSVDLRKDIIRQVQTVTSSSTTTTTITTTTTTTTATTTTTMSYNFLISTKPLQTTTLTINPKSTTTTTAITITTTTFTTTSAPKTYVSTMTTTSIITSTSTIKMNKTTTTTITSTTTTTTTTATVTYSCCQILVLNSSGPASISNSKTLGLYQALNLSEDLSKSQFVYQKYGSTSVFLYFMKNLGSGIWLVGPTIGENKGYLALASISGVPNDRCPEKAGPVWFYLDIDSSWKRDDPTLKIDCSENSN